MSNLIIRNANPEEFDAIGKLMVDAYSALEGFPNAKEIPEYFDTLANIGRLTERPHTELIVAINSHEEVLGAVLYISNPKYYGVSKLDMNFTATSAFRLLAVSNYTRGLGVGRSLINACIEKAKKANHKQLIIHSTEFMVAARAIYAKLGFIRFDDIDFEQDGVEVFGYQLGL